MPNTPHEVIFCGTPEFALPSLQALIDDPDFSLSLVITQPDKPVGRKKVITPPPVKVLAETHNIPVWQPKDINAEWKKRPATSDQRPDFLVVVAYGQILSQDILDAPKIAPVNLHASLLPRWRGASPMQHAILADDRETGVTLQHMIEQLDAGDILAQEKTSIESRETILSLHDRLAEMGAKLLTKTLHGDLNNTPQNTSGITLCKKLNRKSGEVDPQTMTAEEIDRHVRALVPWPGVQCKIDGERIKLIETALESVDEALELTCKKGSILYVIALIPPGKKQMSGAAWQRGKH